MSYRANEYITDVLDGKIPTCTKTLAAVKRHIEDLKKQNTEDFPYYFSEEKAKRSIDFFRFLKHSKGEWAGHTFVLEPWQQFIVWVLFGWLKVSDDTRRFTVGYIEVPRKNGKSTLLAGIGLLCFIADGEAGAEVVTAATKKDQALITHGEATRMVKSSSDLSKRINVFKNNLNFLNSKFEPLGADADTMDGLNIHCAIVDELHAHKTRALWDVLDTATGSRRQPLIIGITTAGFNKQTICYEMHDYTDKVNNGILRDDQHFGIIYSIDEGDDWELEESWKKANPNYGVSVKVDDFKKKVLQAKQMPSNLNSFLRLKMNVWTQAESRWIDPQAWDLCKGVYDGDSLRGRVCYAGLDMAKSIDIAAYVLVFPPEDEDEKVKVLCRFFVPDDNIQKRVKRDRVNYDVWVREGHLIATPGNTIDYKYIIDEIDRDAHIYDIKEIAFDRWGAATVITMLQEHGMEVVEFGQGYASMGPAAKELERHIVGNKIEHDGNPVLTWMANNVVVKEDPSGNIKPDKSKSTEKIDGIVALCMALDRSVRHTADQGSVYDTEEVFFV